jgi:DNA-directed RNA polymerase specialized sigma subunit
VSYVQLNRAVENIIFNGYKKTIRHGEEPELITRARDNDPDAINDLILGYANLIRKTTGLYREVLPAEDLVEGTLLGFSEALATCDGQSLSGKIKVALRHALQDVAGQDNQYEVKRRTLERYFGILNEASGDLDKALELCKTKHMLPETFKKIHEGVSKAEQLDEDFDTLAITTDEPLDEDFTEMLEYCWQAVNGDEEMVLQMVFGFTSYGEPQTVEAVSYTAGLPPRKVRQLKKTGLQAMRNELGLFDLIEEEI